MKAFSALWKISFKNLILTTVNIGRGNKKKAATGVGALLFLGAISAYLSIIYSMALQGTLQEMSSVIPGMQMQAQEVALAMMILMAVFLSIMLMLFAGQEMVFSTKDADLVMSLPVSPFAIMLSRITALYIEALLICELMILPAGIVGIIKSESNNYFSLLILAIEGMLLAALPVLACLLFGTLINAIAGRFKNKTLMTIITNVVFASLFVVIMLKMQSSMNSPEDFLNIGGALEKIFPPAAWAVKGALHFSIGHILLLAVVCVVPLVLATWLISKHFKSILTRLSTHATKQNYKLRSAASKGSFIALLNKEANRFFRTAALVMNSGIIILTVLGACVFAVIKRSDLSAFTAGIGLAGYEGNIAPVVCIMLCFMLAIVNYSAVSISLEGKTLWVLKSLPVSTGSIFGAKITLNFLLCAVPLLIAVPLLKIAFNFSAVDSIVILVLGLLFSAFSSLLGLLVNLHLPRLDAENEMMIVKNSASTIISMLLNMLVLGVNGLMYVMIFRKMDEAFLWFGIASAVLMVALSLICVKNLQAKGPKRFAELIN